MVLERHKRVNLKLKPNKCHLTQTEITFFGHRISKDAIAIDPAKIQLIKYCRRRSTFVNYAASSVWRSTTSGSCAVSEQSRLCSIIW